MLTLPEHERCDRHRHYRMTCEQFESLLARSGHGCEICRAPSERTSWRKLHIDHDGPLWAVRGVLCGNCNIRLGDDNATFPGAREYLDNAWWAQQCAAIGVPAGRRPVPPLTSAIRNQFGIIWIHLRDGWWDAPNQDGHGWGPMTWERLHSSYGPHNLVPYDLRSAYEDQSLPHSVRYPIENGTAEGWAALRRVLEIPEPTPRVKREWQPRDGIPWLATPEKTAKALRFFLAPEECRRIAELLLAGEDE